MVVARTAPWRPVLTHFYHALSRQIPSTLPSFPIVLVPNYMYGTVEESAGLGISQTVRLRRWTNVSGKKQLARSDLLEPHP
jgi:hypothetical protein